MVAEYVATSFPRDEAPLSRRRQRGVAQTIRGRQLLHDARRVVGLPTFRHARREGDEVKGCCVHRAVELDMSSKGRHVALLVRSFSYRRRRQRRHRIYQPSTDSDLEQHLAIEKTGLVSGFLRKQANKSQLGNVTRLQADESIGKSSPNRDCEPHRAEQRPGDELASGV